MKGKGRNNAIQKNYTWKKERQVSQSKWTYIYKKAGAALSCYQREVEIVMPYRTEHAARQMDPDQFTTCRRSKFGKGIVGIVCKRRSDGKWLLQSIRFEAKLWSPGEAKVWLKKHKYKTALEAAKPEK